MATRFVHQHLLPKDSMFSPTNTLSDMAHDCSWVGLLQRMHMHIEALSFIYRWRVVF